MNYFSEGGIKIIVRNPALLHKTLVAGVIIIFLSVCLQPITANLQLETKNAEYYEVTTEFIGLDKIHKTLFTKEEIEKLNDLFKTINNNLKNSVSFENNIEIFKYMIVKLKSYGLLGNIGIEKTEKLVLNLYSKPFLTKMFDSMYYSKKNQIDDDKNLFCLIAGRTTNTIFVSPWSKGLTFSIALIGILLQELLNSNLFGLIIPIALLAFFNLVNPFCFGRTIYFLDSYGKVFSIGLNGFLSWEGNIIGKIPFLLWGGKGALGFTGLKIRIGNYNFYSYYIGFAPYVQIGTY